ETGKTSAPLGMTRSTFVVDSHEHFAPSPSLDVVGQGSDPIWSLIGRIAQEDTTDPSVEQAREAIVHHRLRMTHANETPSLVPYVPTHWDNPFQVSSGPQARNAFSSSIRAR